MKTKLIIKGLSYALLSMGFASAAYAVPVDLNTWTAESYPAVNNFSSGTWTVSGSGSSVNQSVNGQPTFFYSDFNTFGSSFTGSIKVSGSDDDFIGFALGFNPGDTSNSSADYLLIDWKKGNQDFNFGAPSTTPGTTASAGLAVSRVTGIPTADEFWGHTDFVTHTGGGVSELQRAAMLGATGWTTGTTYDFTFDFGPNNLEVFVDGALELDIMGSFSDGRFGFYNFSQADVTYAGFKKEDGSFSVPEPSVLFLLTAGLVGISYSRRKKV
ncbi:MAG TPA: PEP-CTERM sorting domain-containing protein [Gammaproteobacteria bacterium]|nr:PEP-CTERM sorting domain-containing protein [Gammaproteobacteria bacterium]